MPCTDRNATALRSRRLLYQAAAMLLPLVLCGCAAPPPPSSGAVSAASPDRAAPASPAATTAAVPAAVRRAPRYVRLPPPPVSRDWDELQLTAARRLVAAHPDTSYTGPVPEALLGIPVLEIELHADGSVHRIGVVREPRLAKETIQLAIDAVHRAAPYGDVSRLPKPWRWREVFLFDDEHRFKPATLDR